MQIISRLRDARNEWKTKAVARADQLRYFRKKVDRLKRRFERRCSNLEEEVSRLKNENERLRSSATAKPVALGECRSLRTLCVSIVIGGIVSFRSVPRILFVLQTFGAEQPQIPHFTSIIHWALRAGVTVFNAVTQLNSPWIAIIDCSIDIGTRKALVVLRIRLESLAMNQGAVGLKDCECIGIHIATSWNGPLVNDALKEVFAKAGQPVAILKDGGTDLSKGVQLYRESQDAKQVVIIDDVGHVAANALKAEFAKLSPFIKFLEIVRKGAARIRQTDLAWLLPPKIRTKGRFQGITALSQWALKLMEIIGGQGRAKDDSELKKLRKSFAGISQLRTFLENFCATCDVIESFLKLLKQTGFNQATYKEAKALLLTMPEKSRVRDRLLSWLEKHLTIHCRLAIGQTPLLVSSDVIESLFGKFKTIIQRNPQAELNRLVYIIPLLCGTHTKESLDQAIKECSHQQMLNQIENTIPKTLRQQRYRVLDANSRKPIPGTKDLLQTG